MEAKILTMEEMPEAVQVARGVFQYCLQRTVQDSRYITFFEQYANPENVGNLMQQGRLTLWGIYEQGHLIAMSGMQSEGHITMLYVLPIFQRRGYGSQLLETMRTYARVRYGLENVTVNAMPAWTAAYFQRKKFSPVNPAQLNGAPFVSLQAKSIRQVSYEKKTIPAGWILGLSLGTLGLCFFIAVLFLFFLM